MLAVLVVLTASAIAAMAQPDHLRCRHVRAPKQARQRVTLATRLGLDPDCVIRGVAREICEPAYDDSEAGQVDVEARTVAPQGDRLCYRVKCPSRDPREVILVDRFGERIVATGPPTLVCEPIGAP